MWKVKYGHEGDRAINTPSSERAKQMLLPEDVTMCVLKYGTRRMFHRICPRGMRFTADHVVSE